MSSPPPIQSANWSLTQLPGLSDLDRDRLNQLGITSTFHLLRQAWSDLGKEDLSARSGIHLQHIKKWVALADLARVPSVGCQYCGLLLHSGIATLDQLALSSPGPLHRQILKLQVATLRKCPELSPNAGQVTHWTQQAQAIARRERLK